MHGLINGGKNTGVVPANFDVRYHPSKRNPGFLESVEHGSIFGTYLLLTERHGFKNAAVSRQSHISWYLPKSIMHMHPLAGQH